MSMLSKRFKAIFAYVRAKDWVKAKQIIEKRQDELFDDLADMAFSCLLMFCDDNQHVVSLIRLHHDVIARCRTDGIASVFTEDFLATQKPQWPADYDFLSRVDAQMAKFMGTLGPYSEILLPLVSDQVEAELEQNSDFTRSALKLVAEQGLERLANSPRQLDQLATRIAAQNPDLVDALAETLDRAAAQDPHILSTLSEKQKELLEALRELLMNESWSESIDFLRMHPELLSLSAEQEIEHQIRQTPNPNYALILFWHLQLLRRCREVGIEQGFAGLI